MAALTLPLATVPRFPGALHRRITAKTIDFLLIN